MTWCFDQQSGRARDRVVSHRRELSLLTELSGTSVDNTLDRRPAIAPPAPSTGYGRYPGGSRFKRLKANRKLAIWNADFLSDVLPRRPVRLVLCTAPFGLFLTGRHACCFPESRRKGEWSSPRLTYRSWHLTQG